MASRKRVHTMSKLRTETPIGQAQGRATSSAALEANQVGLIDSSSEGLRTCPRIHSAKCHSSHLNSSLTNLLEVCFSELPGEHTEQVSVPMLSPRALLC